MINYNGSLYLLADNSRFYKSKGPRVLVDFTEGYNVIDYWKIICNNLGIEYNILVASGHKQIFNYINDKGWQHIRILRRDDSIDANFGYSLYLSIVNCVNNNGAIFVSDNSLLAMDIVKELFDNDVSCIPYICMYNKKFKDVGVLYEDNRVVSCMFKVKNNIWPNIVYFSSKDINKIKSYILSSSMSFKNKLMYEIVNCAITDIGINFKPVNVTNKCIFLFKHRSL